MKNKKWLLVLIIAFPSLFWLILESSTIHSRKLPIYGAKTLSQNGDTIFQKLNDNLYLPSKEGSGAIKKVQIDFPIYAIVFIKELYRADSYRLTGLWEYLNYKKQKIEHIPFVLVTTYDDAGKSSSYEELKKLSDSPNVHFFGWPKNSMDSLSKTFFVNKPYYIDYSFFALIDANRNVRGYYDGRYVSEIKRLIEEYQHLRLKEEKQKLIEVNEIKSNT